ncbi:CSM3 [Candida theae]|uniref:Chromosome segregation in meiosis protein n=1 Tax=Candida theae TaxID=1198502 RepID=A0AAD5BEY5_9ASCO|nr:CSM3 [Candida theae]KAI5958180.1 CSM3 [Candida theae]
MSTGTAPETEETQRNDNLLDDPALLGIDGPLKLKTRKKIAKIDDDRILHNPRGLPHLIKNQQRLLRIIQKNDKEFNRQEREKLSVKPNYKTSRQAKHDHEYKNLVSILQFYQLWCHGMFPKANFKDCAYLVRSLGHKSSQLRLYRREMIEKEIYKLKVAKGIIDENESRNTNEDEAVEGNDNNETVNNELPELRPTAVNAEDDDDETGWDFMQTGATTSSSNTETQSQQVGNGAAIENTETTGDPDDWDDLEDDEMATLFETSRKTSPQIPIEEEDQFEKQGVEVNEGEGEEGEEEQEQLALELMRQADQEREK